MGTSLLIMVREGFEGALVVAIVLAYLRRVGRLDAARYVWIGVAGAVGVSIAVGVGVHQTIGGLEGDARLRAFAAVAFTAVVLLTWMIFWMRKQGRHLHTELEARAAAALQTPKGLFRGMVAVAFIAVLREGVEAALFLVAAATEDAGRDVVVGALIGLGIAVVLAYLVYLGGRRLPLRAFFTVTGLVLIVFAAGLASRGVMYLQEAGDLGSFNLNGVYDVRSVTWLTQSSEVGKFLAALFGWDPRPSIEQVVVWLGYVVPVTYLFLRGSGAPASRPAEAEATAVPIDGGSAGEAASPLTAEPATAG